MENIKDKLYLDFRIARLEKKEVVNLTGRIFRLLSEQSFLPIPESIDLPDQKPKRISGYSDPVIASATESDVNKKQLGFNLLFTDSDNAIGIATSTGRFCLIVRLAVRSEFDLSKILQLKRLFVDLSQLINPDVALCYPWTANSRIKEKYFEWESRTIHFDFFKWLQYFGPEEFKRNGGDALFQSPYIKAERPGEGVLIQVGESPFDAHTPEGEELIVKATRALPPVVKD